MGDERAHAARLGEGQRLAVVGLAALGIEPVGVGRDVPEQVERVGHEPNGVRRGFKRAVGEKLCVIEVAEQQISLTKGEGGHKSIGESSTRALKLKKMFVLTKSIRRIGQYILPYFNPHRTIASEDVRAAAL